MLNESAPILIGEERGLRTWMCAGPDRLALMRTVHDVIAEHAREDDDVRVSYTAMQVGWTQHPEIPAARRCAAQPAWTELFFEYSALIIIRDRRAPSAEGGDA